MNPSKFTSVLIRFCCFLAVIKLMLFVSYSQPFSNLRTKWIHTSSDTVYLDSLSIIPGSLVCSDSGLVYIINHEKSLFIFEKKGVNIPDSVQVSYRVFPMYFNKQYYHKDIQSVSSGKENDLPFYKYDVYSDNAKPMDFGTLQKQGSISRGVSFGNNQDLGVNSNLNLQLSGKISDNINVLAAITDDNIPIQPEGNTQQIQDFDQVYIQLFDDKTKLTVGDFQLRSKESHYLKYFKKAKGGSVETTTKPQLVENDNLSIQASGAISRGKFARNIIQGVEGNQGPYRLRGDENESFIIVLSGTERIFIDGIQLERGQENDYVIDYNTAEITFTAKRLITKDKRIVVEFQYTDKNYERWLSQFNSEYETKNLNLRFNFFHEQDSKNRTFQTPITDEQKTVLATIGDNLQEAVFDSYDSVGYNTTRVLYKLTKNSYGDTIFVHSTKSDSAIYQVHFSNVGFGNGNYNQVKSTANGRVYEWINPDTINGTIVRKGSYAPVIFIITPKSKQMITLGGTYAASPSFNLDFEAALSNTDLNTFSTQDDRDNVGSAFKVGGSKEIKGLTKNENGIFLVSALHYERIDKKFREIERFRSVEFTRDWNVRGTDFKENQHLGEATLSFQKQGLGTLLNYSFQTFISEAKEFQGVNHFLKSNFQTKGLKVNMTSSFLTSEAQQQNTEFARNKSLISKELNRIEIGFRDDFENNQYKLPGTDSLLSNSYSFLEWEVFVKNTDSLKNEFRLSYTNRTDEAVQNNHLSLATKGESIGFSFGLIKNPNNQLRVNSTYRELRIVNETIASQKPDNTLLNRVEYDFKLFRGAITSSSFYEIGSGLEVKKEFSYLEVIAGQGAFAWKDYNGDSIQTLDEFEVAAFRDEARFIRIFTPTSDFVKAFTNQYNQSLFIRPAAVWNNKLGLRKFLTKFSDQVSYRIDRKTNFEDRNTVLNPLFENIPDTALISLNKSIRNSFYINRNDPKFGFILNYQKIDGKTLLTNGFERKMKEFKDFDLRLSLTRIFMINLIGEEGVKISNSEFLNSRNYHIKYWKAEPRITFQPGTVYRVLATYAYSEKNNTHESGEQTTTQNWGLEYRHNTVGKGSFQLNANYIFNVFKDRNGNDLTGNSPVAFEMLESLQPGKNITWTISYQRTLANNLQMNINYNGRNSEGSKTIHAGGVEVRAFF